MRILEIDVGGDKVRVQLAKGNEVVDSESVISTSIDRTTEDKTYVYKIKSDNIDDLVIIAIHFKNAFRGTEYNIATIDGIWQISDYSTVIEENMEYDNMKICTVDTNAKRIIMINDDNTITLSRDKDICLAENIRIKTADQDDVSPDNPLKFYIYKNIKTPGTYEIRGPVADIENGYLNWDADNFAGFYYDLDNGIKTETLKMIITEDNLLDEETGIEYITKAQMREFDFNEWGQFEVIGFLGEKYFTGYSNGYLYDNSKDKRLPNNEQLSKVLFDDDEERTFTTEVPLKLKDGYDLVIKEVDKKGEKAYIELRRYNKVVDGSDQVIEPSKNGATIEEKTYTYTTDLENTKDIVVIAVHFKNVFRGADYDLATADGIWQISDVTKSVEEGSEYDNMIIDTVYDGQITMINKRKIRLKKNDDDKLMGDIWITTANTNSKPNRFYISNKIVIEEQEGEEDTPDIPIIINIFRKLVGT